MYNLEGVQNEIQEEINAEEIQQTETPVTDDTEANVGQSPTGIAEPPVDQETPEEAAASAQPEANQNEGLITQVGNFLSNAMDAPANFANQITGGLIPSADEQKQAFMDAGPVGEAIVGGGEGIEAGLLAPATLAGRLTNQDTPWSRTPEILKDHPLGETMFQIMEVATPTLVLGGLAGTAAAGGTALVAESALETGLQDNADDLIAGRQIARGFGEIADYLGFDGGQLTRDIIEGQKPEAKVINAVVGFAQNLGINFGINQVMKKFFPNANVVDEATEASVKLAPDGKTVEQVAEGVDNVQTPNYRPDHEPHEAMDIDTAVPVGRPSEGFTYVSPDNLRRELVRRGLDDEGLTSAQRSYFTNYKALADNEGIQRVIREVTKTLEKLPDFSEDLGQATLRASEWWNANKSLIDDNLDDLAANFADPKSGMTRPLDNWTPGGTAYAVGKEALTESLGTTSSGFITGAIIGEELGVRIQKQASMLLNLDEQKIDFTDAMDLFIDLQDAANQFFVPLRRAKRQWAVEGYAQQRQTINSLKDANVKSSRIKPSQSALVPSRELTSIKLDENDAGKTMKELWESAKEGDMDALETLKAYVGYIAHSDPRASMSQVENLTGILKDELLKGNTAAIGRLHYASMLSRISTQVVSLSSGLIRSTFEPAALAVDGAMRRNMGQAMYGLGQLWGGMTHMQDHFNTMIKAFQQNAPVNPGTKFANSYQSLAQQQLDLKQRFKGAIAEAEKAGEDTTSLVLSYHTQMMSLNPQINGPMRVLMTADEGFKSVVATQHATGRAWRKIFEQNAMLDEAKKKLIFKEEFDRVYSEGIETGKITDAEVLQDAKTLSFQRDIHTDKGGSIIGNLTDGAFEQLHQASARNGLFRVFQPFARVAWDINEQSLMVLGGSTPLSRWAAAQMPRYKAVLEGTDEVAKIRYRSMMSAGAITGMSAVGLAVSGNMTGFNSGGLPPQSIKIGTNRDGTDRWISYSRLEPYAATLSIISDAVNSFRYGAISRQEYDKVISEVTTTFGLAFTDKSFMQGMFQMSQLLSLKNYNERSGNKIAEFIGGFSPAILRMIGEKIQPYQTIGSGENGWEDTVASFSRRAFGGVGLPVMYNQYTGQPIPRTGVMSDPATHMNAVGAAMLQEVVPGRVTTFNNDPAQKFMRQVGFQIDEESGIKKYNGVKLSMQEQSILSKDMHDFGKLNLRLTRFANNEGKTLWNRYQKLMEKTPKDAREAEYNDRQKERILTTIRSRLRSIHVDAKKEAIGSGRLSTNEDFRNKVLGNTMSKSPNPSAEARSVAMTEVEALINWQKGQTQVS
jgi:hypothetical protein